MKKSTLFSLVFICFSFCFTRVMGQSTASTTIVYTGFQGCGGCAVCGADYWCFNTLSSYCGNTTPCGTKTFTDPVPPGNIVTSVAVNYYSADCAGGSLTATLDGNTVPTVNEGNTGCACSNNPCGQSASSSSNFPCGLPGYVYGGSNSLQLCTGSSVCINKLILVFTYAPANQATPATQPGAITGPSAFCAGTAVVYSIPAVANAASYTWSVPAGWTINSGQGTTSINVTPSSTAGNICVYASNLCGSSAQTCMPVVLNTPSTPPTSASATPPSVCGSGSATLTANGGSLGTGASWQWYSGSCNGIAAGSGNSIVVSASSTTTYYVNAVGTCNTTACASVVFTINPIPTANAGPTAVLTCANTSTTLSGSGGGSYAWSGPGIVSGGATANPTINQPGTYSLVVTTAGCPSAVSTVAITQNTTQPAVSISVPGMLTCANTSIVLNGGPGSGVSYSWSGPGIVSGGTTASPTINQPGTYTLTNTNPANGCTSFSTTTVSQSASPPAVSSSASGTLTCSTTSVNVMVSTAASPVTYNWSGPGITAGAGTGTITVNQGGTYSYTVVNTSNGCQTTGTQVVAQNTTQPAVTPGSGTITCTTNTVNANATTAVSPATYNWSGTGIVSGQGTGTITVNQPGVFSYTVTNSNNGCSTASSLTVPSNTTAPVVTVSPANYTTTCAAPSVTLTANSITAGLTYTWTNTGGSLSNTNTANPVATGGGTYSVTVTDPTNGCQASSSATVVPDASAPMATISTSSASLTCVVSSCSATVTANPSSNLTYSWSPAPAAGASSSAATFTTSGTYVCTVTNTVNACTASAQITVSTDTSTPSVSVTPSQTITCLAPTAAISSTTMPSANITYSWSGPGIVGGVSGAGITANQAGTYTLLVTNSVNGCTNTATSGITSNIANPTATISAISSNSMITCATPTVSLGVTSTPSTGVTYTWTPGGASTSTTSTSSTCVASVIVMNTSTGCSVTAQYTVTGNTTPPPVTAPAAVLPCAANTTTLTASSTDTNVSYSWTTGTGSILSGSNTATPGVGQIGSYVVTVTDNLTGCSNTATVTVTQSSVTAAFTANPTSGLAPLAVNFTNQSTGATGYTWTFGDTNTSTATNPSNTYTTNGTYTVMLIASAGPCSDTAYVTIIVNDGLTLEIPNVFTPNNDNVNDIFTIKATGVKEIALQIFNRWGEKMYEFAGPKAGWDGSTAHGLKVPDGTYFYFVKATGYDDKVIQKEGTVNLYR